MEESSTCRSARVDAHALLEGNTACLELATPSISPGHLSVDDRLCGADCVETRLSVHASPERWPA
eukprot:6000146-Prymnesium_polylepis.1